MKDNTKKTVRAEAEEVTEVKSSKIIVTADVLNVRSEASLDSNVVSLVYSGEILETTEATKGFYPVIKDGIKGFVKSDFVKIVEE